MIIYYADINDFDDSFYSESVGFYPEKKQDSMLNSKNEKAKKESLLAWRIVSHFCGDVKNILQNEHGKPYFEDKSCFFSISHSNGKIIVAADKTEIGADIELIKQPSDAVVRRVLSDREAEVYNVSDNKAFCFTRFWTLRESYVKFFGSTIAENLKSLDFSSFAGNEKFSYKNLNFCSFDIDGFSVSICSKNAVEKFEIMKPGQTDF